MNLPADQLVVDCGSAPDGFSCEQRELGTFGTCLQGTCHRHCKTPEQCSDPRDHDADLGDQSADPRDHVTMRRSWRSRCRVTRILLT
jgi:hypothetical protein